MDERRPYAPAKPTVAPGFNATPSALATVDPAKPSSDAPSRFVVSERRGPSGYVLESQRSAGSFARWMIWTSVVALWVIGWTVACVRVILDGQPDGALALFLFLVAPVLPFVWWLVRRAFDSSRITLNSEGVCVEGGLLTVADIGVTRVALEEIFAFAIQNDGVSATRLMVLTRDGEAKLLRCNVLDRAHAIFVVTRLNRELAALRDAGHYRG